MPRTQEKGEEFLELESNTEFGTPPLQPGGIQQIKEIDPYLGVVGKSVPSSLLICKVGEINNNNNNNNNT